MKQTILLLSILFSVQCFGQKWHLNTVDKSKEYAYEYWFQFENIEDTCSYQVTKNSGSQNSDIKLFDNKGDKVIFANIKFINIDYETEINLTSDFNGNNEVRLEDGKYKVEVRAMNYDNFNLEFETKDGQKVEIKIKLGLAPELDVYQIDSKKELKKTEIFEITECVIINRNEYYKTCSDLNKYRIMMHI
jgi:uncharacterized membrane protein